MFKQIRNIDCKLIALDMFSCFHHTLFIVILFIYIVLECLCLFILFCILFSFIVDEDLMVD